ncbi:hypothetical protein [Bradyrhizobium sp.]|uniref:hypothetical protein n=1 Tax=Bradyrhizobium sp. TaxID=376 RepID=UPI003D1058F0
MLTPQPESLTKREVFAAMAMQGILAHVEFGGANDDQVARWSVRQADYLIAALNAAPTEPQS